MAYREPRGLYLNPQHLPADEQQAGKAVSTALLLLPSYTVEIGAAVDLFDQSGRLMLEEEPEYARGREWRFLAARAGAIAIYNFAETMMGAREVLRQCPTWDAKVDAKALKFITKQFNAYFPFTENIRHSVAHESEFMVKLKETAKHSLPSGGIIMKQLREDEYVTTYNGNLVSYRVNGASFGAVFAAADAFLTQFEPCLPKSRT